MKKFSFTFLLLFFSFTVFSQVYFDQRDILVQKEIDAPFALFAADLNDDGYNEILVTNYDGYNVGFYPNLTTGDFGKFNIVDVDFRQAYDVFAADLDGDSRKDIIASGSAGVFWYKNNGNFDFSSGNEIISAVGQIRSVYASDLDDDGDNDLVIANFTNDIVGWFENDGNGNFSSLNQLTDTMDGAQEVIVFDLDGDGDNDILAGAYFDSLYWFENDGNGNFTAEQLFSSDVNTTFSIFAADFDNDSDLDVFIGDQGDNKVAYYENLGGGNYSSQRVISTAFSGIRSVYVAELNGDNLPDVVAAAYFSDYIVWFKNLGGGTFNSGTVIAFDNTENFTIADDFDNDGDNDVFYCNYSPDQVKGIINDGNGNFSSSFSLKTEAYGLYNIELVDLNNDNLQDVVYGTVYNRELAWCKNQGDGTFEKRALIDESYPYNDVVAADFDGDNDKDLFVVSSAYDLVLYFENTGNVNFASSVTLCDTLDYPKFLETADINNDGRVDVVGTSFYDDRVWIFYNLGNGSFSSPNIISDSVNGANHLAIADLDGDNDLDIVVSSYLDNKVFWLENIDGVNFSHLKLVTTYLNRPGRPFPVDMDNDGDSDILCAEQQGQYIYWYQNDGTGSFVQQLISSNYSYGSVGSIAATDVDKDGDIDVLVGSTHADKLIWYENLGGQTWDAPKLIAEDIETPVDMKITDMNGDAYPDLFSASYDDRKILWFENMPLQVLQQPVDTMVCAFDNAIFKVSAKNATSFQWKVSTDGGVYFDNINDNGTYSGANDSILHINGTTPQMSGYKYFCVMSNPGGQTPSNIVTLYVDTIYPQLQVSEFTLYLDNQGNAILQVQDIISSASDNCGLSDTVISKTNFSCDDVGTNLITVYLTDTKGNTVLKTTNVYVIDSIKPVIITDELNFYLDANGQVTITSDSIETNDNCAIAQISLSQENFSCSDLGANQITVSVQDVNGNITNKTITVNVYDTIYPQLSVENTDLYLDSSGNAYLNPENIIVSLSDNCQIVDTVLSQSVFNCQDVGQNTVTLTVSDNAANQIQKNFYVFVYDTLLPYLTADTLMLFLDESGSAILNEQNLPAYDNCEMNYITISQTSFDCSHTGANQISVRMNDGNTDTVDAQITVLILDTIAPYLTCVQDTVNFVLPDGQNYYTVQGGELSPTDSGDNCQIKQISNSYNNSSTMDGEQLSAGIYDIWWIIEDNVGNKDSCLVVVNVSSNSNVGKFSGIQIYPNPVRDLLMVSLENEKITKIQLCNIDGKILKQVQSNQNIIYFDLSGFPAGVYILKVCKDSGITEFKVIKE